MPRMRFFSVRICARPECTTRTENYMYCSKRCYDLSNRKVVRPEKEDLAQLVQQYPMTVLAKYYGVSDKAIAKWCIQYQIPRPPRGSWGRDRKSLSDLTPR